MGKKGCIEGQKEDASSWKDARPCVITTHSSFAFQKHGLMDEAARILHEMIAMAFNLTSSHRMPPSAAMQVLGSSQKLGMESNLLRRVAAGQGR